MNLKELKLKIEDFRQRIAMSQKEFAECLGISQQSYSAFKKFTRIHYLEFFLVFTREFPVTITMKNGKLIWTE